jgi:predicted nucleic acid-binding protein
MIVVDASAVVELLIDSTDFGDRVRAELAADAEWAVPGHLVVEVANALRGLWLGGRASDDVFDAHLYMLGRLEFTTFAVSPLLPRIRALARNATPYDAAYLVLAERLHAPLVTVDRKLARVPGVTADVRVITSD